MNRRLLDIAILKAETFKLQIKRRHDQAYQKEQPLQENPNGAQQSDNQAGQPPNPPETNIPAG